MAELKTKPTTRSAARFLAAIPDPDRRRDCRTVARIMRQATRSAPRMWGTSIVGFGSYHYRYASGREGDWFLTGFAPRARDLTLYVTAGFDGYGPLLRKLGTRKTGRSCLYLERLDDVDLDVLTELIERSVAYVRRLSAPRTKKR